MKTSDSDLSAIAAQLRERIARRRALGYGNAPVRLEHLEYLLEAVEAQCLPPARMAAE